MKYDRNKNAKVIIPLAIAVWLGGILVFEGGAPALFEALFVVAFFIAVPTAVFYLISASGWRPLAKHSRAPERYAASGSYTATGPDGAGERGPPAQVPGSTLVAT